MIQNISSTNQYGGVTAGITNNNDVKDKSEHWYNNQWIVAILGGIVVTVIGGIILNYL